MLCDVSGFGCLALSVFSSAFVSVDLERGIPNTSMYVCMYSNGRNISPSAGGTRTGGVCVCVGEFTDLHTNHHCLRYSNIFEIEVSIFPTLYKNFFPHHRHLSSSSFIY